MTTLAIHNGRVIDPALGRDGIADVVIVDGRIARVGPNEGDMVVEAERIDATGLIVTPGFVDPHTHYDAQICFDPYAFPAIEHGVTSIVIGDCCASCAPVPPKPDSRRVT